MYIFIVLVCCFVRSVEKPFRFYVREEAKKRQRQNEDLYKGSKREKNKNVFKAKPVPKVVRIKDYNLYIL